MSFVTDTPPRSSLLRLADLSLAIIDDDPQVRERVGSYFGGMSQFSEVLTFQDAKSAYGSLARRQVDVVLVDFDLQGDSGLHCIRWLSRTCSARLIIAYTSNEEPEMIERVLQAGVHGYLLKSEQLASVYGKIQRAMAGEPAISATVIRTLIGRVKSLGPNRARLKHLTSQENRVLALTADGLECKAVAEKLGLSVHTVYVYNKRIIKKLAVSTRFAAVQLFREAQHAAGRPNWPVTDLVFPPDIQVRAALSEPEAERVPTCLTSGLPQPMAGSAPKPTRRIRATACASPTPNRDVIPC